MMYTGNEAVYSYTFEHHQKSDCPVCGGEAVALTRARETTLQDLVELLLERHDFQIKRPSLSVEGRSLYLQAPPQLEKATRPNLDKTLAELIADGDVLTVTDASLPFSLSLAIAFA